LVNKHADERSPAGSLISAVAKLQLHKGTFKLTGINSDITMMSRMTPLVLWPRVDLADSNTNRQKLFISGKIKVQGAIMMAAKLNPIIEGAQEFTDFRAKL